MGRLIDFETSGVASLQRRVAAAEEANQDLLAFARGQSGAASAIHAAALAALDAEGADHLVHILTQLWPDLLGVDAVAFALDFGDRALRGDAAGVHPVARGAVRPACEGRGGVVVRVGRGHALFGPACDLVRVEALIPLHGPPPLRAGVLLLGQRCPQGFEARYGSEPLLFLGGIVARMAVRWLAC